MDTQFTPRDAAELIEAYYQKSWTDDRLAEDRGEDVRELFLHGQPEQS